MVQSVQRAVRILRELAAAGPRLGVTELAERIGVSKPTVHALLRTLEAEGLVRQEKETSKYLLGSALLRLGNSYLETQELRSRTLPWADSLAERTGEAVWVAVLDDRHVLVVHHTFRRGSGVQILELGATIPWNTCALGKAMVAFLPQPEREALLEGELAMLTGHSVVDPAVLAGQLEEIRRLGYAQEDQESALGEAGIASPVFERSGQVAGAIGVVGSIERLLAGESRQQHAITVCEVATLLSRELGAGRGIAWQTSG
jgi:DNA-binding IclR family transcriptional regulator